MDLKIILGLISLAGILISALVSSTAYFYKSRTEIKRSNRRVLYLLLELRFSFGVSVISPAKFCKAYLKHYIDKLKGKGIQCEMKEFEGAPYDLLLSHISEMLSISRDGIEKNLLEPFQSALIELSSINPTLAYQLKGHEKLQKIIAQSKKYKQDAANLTEEDESADEKFSIAIENIESTLVADMYDTLDNDIIRLASSCGFGCKKKCKKIIASRKGDIEHHDFKELDQYFDVMFTDLFDPA